MDFLKTIGNFITIAFFTVIVVSIYFPIREHLGLIGEGVYFFSLISLCIISLIQKYKKNKY